MKTNPFQVSIFKYSVKNWNFKKKELLNLFNNSNHKILDNVIISPLNIETNIFSEEIKMFEKEIGISFNLQEFWFQKYKNNMDHPVHNHGQTGFSSVCFLEYDKDNHKPTIFISPFGNYINGQVDRHNPKVEEGDIIFFPSNLLHYSPVNTSNKDRIVVSFNLMIKFQNDINFNYQ